MFQNFTLNTGYGAWNPLFWVIAAIIACIIGWLIWRTGRATYNTNPEATAPFLSGNAEPEKGAVHIRGGNLYWGYTDALASYYNLIKPIHNGNTADYLLGYLFVTAILLVVMVVVK